MKKMICYALTIGLVFLLMACNEPTGGPPGGDVEDTEITLNYSLTLESGTGYLGGTIDLAEYKLADISKYASVTVNAELRDEDGNAISQALINELTSQLQEGDSLNLAQFFILKEGSSYGSSNDDILGGSAGKKYNMVANGTTTLFIPSGMSGKPGKLQIETQYPDNIKYAYIRSIVFAATSDTPNVVFDWGTTKTELFPTDKEWPGRSLPLSGASITGTLGDLSLYKEIIVEAVVYDRNDAAFTSTGKTPHTFTNSAGQPDVANAFFTLITDNSNWEGTSPRVKQYNMELDGATSVTPETNKVTSEQAWTGIPTDIVFQGRYVSSQASDVMVGYVELKTITFVPK
ncbi:MAG: hypothetical protein LBH20_05410 [Treponema sp.]|jgi:hypothetical protein|nr:hypothetical protein [Treponema sp.]